jgi:acyl-homoserine-lactone acylase
VREALARVALALDDAGWSADSPWGAAHAIEGPAGTVGVPGGSGAQGVFDVLESEQGFGTWRGWTGALGGTAPEHLFGASYVHVVRLGPDGPEASGLLTYSQATEPSSPWYLDQLELLSASEWFAFPFTEADIAADPALVEITL